MSIRLFFVNKPVSCNSDYRLSTLHTIPYHYDVDLLLPLPGRWLAHHRHDSSQRLDARLVGLLLPAALLTRVRIHGGEHGTHHVSLE